MVPTQREIFSLLFHIESAQSSVNYKAVRKDESNGFCEILFFTRDWLYARGQHFYIIPEITKIKKNQLKRHVNFFKLQIID